MPQGAGEVHVVEVEDVQPVAGELVTGHGLAVLVMIGPCKALLTNAAVNLFQFRIFVWITILLTVTVHMIL